jgi:hypothetical protein
LSEPQLTAGQILVVTGVWSGYFILHSFTASLWLKRLVAGRLPALMPAYRLLFNLLALLGLAPPLWLLIAWRGTPLWAWSGIGWWLANGLALAAVIGFVWSLRFYDGDEFLGLRQLRAGERRVEDQEHLHISPLHRHVRHPWYALGLVIIWSRDMDAVTLLSNSLLTLYFIVGYRLEERKLLTYHGERYRRYREKVPGLIPLPWRCLSRAEAELIVKGQF